MSNKKLTLYEEVQNIRMDLHRELFIFGPTYKKRKNNFKSLKDAINERVYKPLRELENKLLKEQILH